MYDVNTHLDINFWPWVEANDIAETSFFRTPNSVRNVVQERILLYLPVLQWNCNGALWIIQATLYILIFFTIINVVKSLEYRDTNHTRKSNKLSFYRKIFLVQWVAISTATVALNLSSLESNASKIKVKMTNMKNSYNKHISRYWLVVVYEINMWKVILSSFHS